MDSRRPGILATSAIGLALLSGCAVTGSPPSDDDTVDDSGDGGSGVSVEIRRRENGPDGDTSYAPADTEPIDVTLAIPKP